MVDTRNRIATQVHYRKQLQSAQNSEGDLVTNEEISEIVVKGQQDGAQLFRVADAIYSVLIGLDVVVGILGVLLFFTAMDRNGIGPALGVAIATTIICAVGYAGAVLTSNMAKVLVHLLFSNLALLDAQRTK